MLWEPGPLTPIPDSEFPVAGVRPSLAADAAAVAAQLGIHDQRLGGASGAIVAAADAEIDGGAGLDLGAAMAAHDDQARDFDPSIADVAGNAGAQDGEIAGLMIETGDDIRAGEPAPPDYVEHQSSGAPPAPPGLPRGPDEEPGPPPPEPPPSGSLYDYVASLYRELLDREGSDGEIQGWVDAGLSAQAIRDGFIGSDEYREKHGG